MRKQSFLKVTLLIIVALIFSVMTGCGNPLSREESLMYDSEDITLTAFVQQSASSESGLWRGWAADKLYEDTHIKIEFLAIGDGGSQKLKQYLSSGDLPDLIGFKGTDQAQLAMDTGALLPLDEYKELLPNIFENDFYQHAISYTETYISNDSGHLFMMPVSIGPASRGFFNWLPMVQWDLYKKVGKPDLDTLEDLLDLVEIMQNEKPTTENGEKVYGFSLFSEWDEETLKQVAALSFFYGIDTEYVSNLMETNVLTKEISSIFESDSFYRRALKFYFEANQRGLLDPDSMTQTYENVNAKISDGRILFSHYSWMTGSYNLPASGHVNNEQGPDGYVPVVADDMKFYLPADQLTGRNWYFGISKNAKDIERTCELLNWLYDPENIAYLINGPEDVIWEMTPEGQPVLTAEGMEIIDNPSEPLMPEEVGGGSFQDGSYRFNALGIQAQTLMDDGYSLGYRYWPSYLNRNPSLLSLELQEFYDGKNITDYLHDENMVVKTTQAVNMMPGISDDMQVNVIQIGEVVKRLSWKMIYASNEAEFDQFWEDIVTEASNLGFSDIEAYYKKTWKEALSIAELYE